MATNNGTACISQMIDNGSVESKRYYMARRTVLEMLRDRGYAVSIADLSISLFDFRAFFSENPDPERLRVVAARISNPSKKIMVIFCGTNEIRKQNIVGILSQIMNKETLERVILVLQSKMNWQAKKVIDAYSIKVETFQITDLLANLTKHVLMPNYKILNAEEKKQLLKQYSVEAKQLPVMLEGDAFARYYGLVKGQVVKVTYCGPITNSVVTYRCIV